MNPFQVFLNFSFTCQDSINGLHTIYTAQTAMSPSSYYYSLLHTSHEEHYVCFTKRLVHVSDYTELIRYSILLQV